MSPTSISCSGRSCSPPPHPRSLPGDSSDEPSASPAPRSCPAVRHRCRGTLLMIFVTVGTTDFDALVRRIDELAPSLGEEVLCQIGKGSYLPRNCRYFRYAPSLDE